MLEHSLSVLVALLYTASCQFPFGFVMKVNYAVATSKTMLHPLNRLDSHFQMSWIYLVDKGKCVNCLNVDADICRAQSKLHLQQT